MAKNTQIKEDKKIKKRKGVHSKNKSSYLKSSKFWVKKSRGQGK
jgi:hypothetical protein